MKIKKKFFALLTKQQWFLHFEEGLHVEEANFKLVNCADECTNATHDPVGFFTSNQ